MTVIETLCAACGKNMLWVPGREWKRCKAEDDEYGIVCDTLNYWPGGAR